MTTLSAISSTPRRSRTRLLRRALGAGAGLAVAGLLAAPLSPAPPADAADAVGAVGAVGAASAAAVAPPSDASAQAVICDIYCDARDPAQATGDRVPVSATIHGRTLRLHVSDPDVMGWGSIEGGQAGDEVWLDR